MYMPIGFDTKTEYNKHYRAVIDKTLEESKYFSKPPFDCLIIKRGSQI